MGAPLFDNIMEQNVTCQDAPPACAEQRAAFRRAVKGYATLASATDYMRLDGQIRRELPAGTREAGRIFYLAVPPHTYGDLAGWIHAHGRPGGDAPAVGDHPWLRVLIEKPFGHDAPSARALDARIALSLAESEVYRVDHYLVKDGVMAIRDFRNAHRAQLEPLLRAGRVERVEVVMTEHEDAAGRTAFYDRVGVVRDVMQNHLTAVLATVAMDLSGGDVQQQRAAVVVRLNVSTVSAADGGGVRLDPGAGSTAASCSRRAFALNAFAAQYSDYRQQVGRAQDVYFRYFLGGVVSRAFAP